MIYAISLYLIASYALVSPAIEEDFAESPSRDRYFGKMTLYAIFMIIWPIVFMASLFNHGGE